MELSAIPPLPRTYQAEGRWQERFLTCHTLHTVVEQRQPMDWTLRCSVPEAKAILALYLGNKALATPQYAARPQRVLSTEMTICQLTPRQMAHIPLHLDPPKGLWDRLEKFWLWRPVLRYRLELETAVGETVYEVFHLSGWRSLPGKKPSREALRSLGLLHLHFYELANGGSYLRAFVGWNEACAPESQQQLWGLLDDYLTRLHFLDGQPVRPKGAGQERARHRASFSESPPVREMAVAAKPVLTKQQPDVLAETTESTLGWSPQPDALDGALAPSVPQTAGETQLLSALELEAEGRHWVGGERPRLYKKSLLKICRMEARRQALIKEGKAIPDITLLARKHGPSKNTLDKAGNLLAEWHNPSFAWNVITWLRDYSSHSAEEITDYLTYLRTSLGADEWAAVTGGG